MSSQSIFQVHAKENPSLVGASMILQHLKLHLISRHHSAEHLVVLPLVVCFSSNESLIRELLILISTRPFTIQIPPIRLLLLLGRELQILDWDILMAQLNPAIVIKSGDNLSFGGRL